MKTVLLFSGGIDSTVLLHDLRDQGHEVWTLWCDYGQAHARGERRVVETYNKRLGIRHRNVHLDPDLFAGSELTGGEARLGRGGVVVPNRNMVMIALAGSVAERFSLDFVAIGCHADDRGLFPDCRQAFLEAANSALKMATEGRVRLQYPYVGWPKEQVVRRGWELGVDLGGTWSCYATGTEPPCGTCLACRERARALAGGERFVLERIENPHPKMLAGAVEARAAGGPFWDGYLASMADATGETPDALLAWMDRVVG